MPKFISNRSISCTHCGCSSIKGKESIRVNDFGKTIKECKWTCPSCGNLIRRDDIELAESK